MKNSFLLLFIASILTMNCLAQKYEITNKIKIGGEGGWDYIAFDDSSSRIFVSHSNSVVVVDALSRKIVGKIENTKGVHGIAIASDLNKAYTSNGKDTTVTVFNLKTLEVLTKVKITGLNPDAILYDPFTKRIFTFNGKTNNSTVIDAKTDKVIETIALNGKPEFAVTDFKGRIFVNIEDKNELQAINSINMKVEKTWSVSPGDEPSGLAFDIANHRLFAVCANNKLVILDSETGKLVTTVKVGKGVDGVVFDADLKRIYTSNGEGTITIVQEENENTFKVLENFSSQKGARTIALNPKTHQLYLPTAEINNDKKISTGKEQPKRPSYQADSFEVIEVGVR